MKLTFLGTGTSHGVPVIGCDCPTCTSGDPKNKRLRSSLLVQAEETTLVTDTPPDFRQQMLTTGIRHIDAVLYTHAHADHVFGFDDLRRFGELQQRAVPIYATAEVTEFMKQAFSYIFGSVPAGTTVPQVQFNEWSGAFSVGGITVAPLPVYHGPSLIHGFLFSAGGKRVAYVPDCSAMPDATRDDLQHVDVMILDALRRRPHPTHLDLDQSIEILERIQAKRSFIVHMCHELEHEETQKSLPEGIEVSYDGLVVEV